MSIPVALWQQLISAAVASNCLRGLLLWRVSAKQVPKIDPRAISYSHFTLALSRNIHMERVLLSNAMIREKC
jgi:hypothetical protein